MPFYEGCHLKERKSRGQGGKTGGGWTSPQEEKRDLIHWEKLRKGKRQETEKLDQPDSYEDGGRENSLVE